MSRRSRIVSCQYCCDAIDGAFVLYEAFGACWNYRESEKKLSILRPTPFSFLPSVRIVGWGLSPTPTFVRILKISKIPTSILPTS